MSDQPKQKQQPKKKGGGVTGRGKSDMMGITVPKDQEHFSDWYTQVIQKAELIEYYDVSGCYILRPAAYALWEAIQQFFDGAIKKSGVQNAYFPIFVSEAALNAEKDHVEGFMPEVAWVTKSGKHDLAAPIALRPTSETVMYPAYAKWIRSHRDLPLRLNQWANVVRWEFSHPVPFLRSREFLWQEGHTAFATQQEAEDEVMEILDLYARVYEELMAVPVTKGRKSEKEKFAGGLFTTTIEAFVPVNGRSIQAATSHCLGQNFAKMFNIKFEDEQGGQSMVWQNSWGLSTRSIGTMIMIHGDDKGLVMPPRIAPLQAVVVPILRKGADNDATMAMGQEIVDALVAAGVRAKMDTSGKTPGFIFNHYDVRGVPLKIEVGPRDVEARACVLSRRDNGEKTRGVPVAEVVDKVREQLDAVHENLFQTALAKREAQRKTISEWSELVPALDQKCAVIAPFCDRMECEDDIKKRSAAESKAIAEQEESVGFKLSGACKTLCAPFELNKEAPAEGTKCIGCGQQAKAIYLFGRSY